ncbi:NACHT domain-containing protein [Burkholderia pseudomallei]|uniref:NACHT domain-containing protein n=1 Tax=Burkholderia pseudomallei TaxID=28450 RepID=UPI0012AEC6EA|nr:hypothetical protein [Burkholderia pseudomallei]
MNVEFASRMILFCRGGSYLINAGDEMNVPQWKMDKIHALKDEVKELHPTLHDLFLKIPYIRSIQYTHGPNEMGADFVLVREDNVLLQEKYIGIIAKADDIKQDYTDLKRQIDECGIERTIDGGKRSIYLSEIWIVTSQNITNNARTKLHRDHKTTNISFLDGAAIAKLIEKHFPEYWDRQTARLSSYITSQSSRITSIGSNHSLLPPNIGSIRVDQQIYRIPDDAKNSFRIHSPHKTTNLISELQRRRAIFIEGGMGSGKSELLRSTAVALFSPDHLNSTKILPLFLTYREFKEKVESLNSIVKEAREYIDDESYHVAIFIDGMDEVSDCEEEKISLVCKLSNDLLQDDKLKLVITSRNIDGITRRKDLAKSFEMYQIAPLAFSSLVNFIQKICNTEGVSDRLRSDLQKSPLLKALPRTPLSAILLAKLLSENVKDLPSTLPELYSKYTELALGRWDLRKGNGSEKEYETVYRLTANLAAYMLENDLDVVGIGEVGRLFKDYLDRRNTGQNADAIQQCFVASREIVAYDSENKTIQFRHRTFAEFFYSQNIFYQQGRSASIKKPFHPYWKSIEYFYLGLIKDAPERINQLSAIAPDGVLEKLIKCTQLGLFMLAAYQTPYESLEGALYRAFVDAAEICCAVSRGEHNDSPLATLPELQVLALLTQSLKQSYGYEFFQRALVTAKIKLAEDVGLVREVGFVAEFFIDSVLAELDDASAFVRLIENHESELNWSLRLGISCSANDAKFSNDSIRRIEKKLRRAIEKNKALHQFIDEIEGTPIKDRKMSASIAMRC